MKVMKVMKVMMVMIKKQGGAKGGAKDYKKKI
jgi:hypothetical protein